MQGPSFTIGELARRAGVSADTIRYYERRRVLQPPARGANGYRRYDAASVQRVQFVRNALRVGFSLKQIAGFLHARETGRPPCREVRAAAGRIVEDMNRQIREMIASRSAIIAMLSDWDQRLDTTPAGTPARLLDHTSTLTAPRIHPPPTRRRRS